MKEYKLTDWLPTTKKEVEMRGWKELDVILFSGDAYVDPVSYTHLDVYKRQIYSIVTFLLQPLMKRENG